MNGRLEPSGVVDGFQAEIGASGSFCPKHLTLPVTAFFFSLSDDNAPSPYLVRQSIHCYYLYDIDRLCSKILWMNIITNLVLVLL